SFATGRQYAPYRTMRSRSRGVRFRARSNASRCSRSRRSRPARISAEASQPHGPGLRGRVQYRQKVRGMEGEASSAGSDLNTTRVAPKLTGGVVRPTLEAR